MSPSTVLVESRRVGAGTSARRRGELLGDVSLTLRSPEHRQAKIGFTFHSGHHAAATRPRQPKGEWQSEIVDALLAREWRGAVYSGRKPEQTTRIHPIRPSRASR